MIFIKVRVAVAVAALILIGVVCLLLSGAGVSTSDTSTACAVPQVSLGTGAITMPMKEGTYRISSGYGPRTGGFHAGVDFAAPVGTPIYAAHDGIVAQAKGPGGPGEPGEVGGFQTWVVLDGTLPDGTRYSTVYGHMSTYSVSTGETVSAGQQIATVGSRGQSTGPHLHFEVWPGTRLNGGASTDPMGWLNTNAGPGQAAPTTSSAPDPVLGDVVLTGPVPAQGRQATMAINPTQQTNINTIVGVVKGQNLPLRVAVIAVATAMQESQLTVIDYGDAAGPDSRGLFQQRAPWGSYEERMDPVISTQLFLNGGRGGQKGLLSKDWQHLSLEQAVVQTQISVGGYAKWETQAIGLVAAAVGVDPIAAGGAAPNVACTPPDLDV